MKHSASVCGWTLQLFLSPNLRLSPWVPICQRCCYKTTTNASPMPRKDRFQKPGSCACALLASPCCSDWQQHMAPRQVSAQGVSEPEQSQLGFCKGKLEQLGEECPCKLEGIHDREFVRGLLRDANSSGQIVLSPCNVLLPFLAKLPSLSQPSLIWDCSLEDLDVSQKQTIQPTEFALSSTSHLH